MGRSPFVEVITVADHWNYPSFPSYEDSSRHPSHKRDREQTMEKSAYHASKHGKKHSMAPSAKQ